MQHAKRSAAWRSVPVCLLGLWALAAADSLARSMSWAAQEVPEPIASAAQLQSRIDLLRRHAAVTPPDYNGAPDARGRTFQQDASEWLMSAPTAAELETLRNKARAQESAHQKAALSATLEQATALVQQEVYRGDLLRNYWANQARLQEQQRLLDGLQARLAEAERTPPAPEIRIAQEEAGRQLAAAASAANPAPADQQAGTDKVRGALDAALSAYDTERARLAKVVGDSERARGIAPLALARSEACAPAASGTSGKPKPEFAPNTKPNELDYPATMRRLSIEGVVVVAVTVSPGGCATRAEVYTSSGARQLDESALHWILSAQFLPAEKDQKPVESVARLGVRFRLAD